MSVYQSVADCVFMHKDTVAMNMFHCVYAENWYGFFHESDSVF